MKTLLPKDEQKTTVFLDRALNEWVPKRELARLVPQIVRTARAEEPGNAGAHHDVTLAVLVYCYAIGVYRSKEIEQRLSRSRLRSGLPSDAILDGKCFAAFRKSQKPLVKKCLISALQQAFRVRWKQGGPDAEQGQRFLSTGADLLSPLDCEAERRMEIAEAWDLFDQDGLVGRSERGTAE